MQDICIHTAYHPLFGSIPDYPGSNGISFKSIKNQIQKTGHKYPISSFYICYICYRPIYQRQNGVSTKPHNRSEEHTSELQSRFDLVCRLLLENKKYTVVM